MINPRPRVIRHLRDSDFDSAIPRKCTKKAHEKRMAFGSSDRKLWFEIAANTTVAAADKGLQGSPGEIN
jgi:hypothetical protein